MFSKIIGIGGFEELLNESDRTLVITEVNKKYSLSVSKHENEGFVNYYLGLNDENKEMSIYENLDDLFWDVKAFKQNKVKIVFDYS